MAPKGKSQHSANLGYDHGKAVLCSNIHQRGNRENNLGESAFVLVKLESMNGVF